jgi:hypothetical protein
LPFILPGPKLGLFGAFALGLFRIFRSPVPEPSRPRLRTVAHLCKSA